MWGNTVNVASRMESTGRAGSIQVSVDQFFAHFLSQVKLLLERTFEVILRQGSVHVGTSQLPPSVQIPLTLGIILNQN